MGSSGLPEAKFALFIWLSVIHYLSSGICSLLVIGYVYMFINLHDFTN